MPEITEEELAELAKLREERDRADLAEARRRKEAAAKLTPPTHYLHLADGRVVDGSNHATHHTEVGEDGADICVPVVAAYPKGA